MNAESDNGKKYECPKCHRADSMKMIRIQITQFDMDEDGYRDTEDAGEVISDSLTDCKCDNCNYQGQFNDFVKDTNDT